MKPFPPRYLRLEIGAPTRLAELRRMCAHSPLHARTWKLHNYSAAYGHMDRGRQSDGSPVWYSHTGHYFRHERATGPDYYTDSDGNGTARGIVASLPHGRFLAGYEWTDNGERVWFPGIFNDECDAAKMADEHARVFAEVAMEDSQNYARAREIEDSIESNMVRLRECIALRHMDCMAYVRNEARELIGSIRRAREVLRAEYFF
jgi:hypothetical protein